MYLVESIYQHLIDLFLLIFIDTYDILTFDRQPEIISDTESILNISE